MMPSDSPPGVPIVAPQVYPLDEFYARAGLPLPHIELIAGDQIPEPYHRLLVHQDDMTPTLEAHYGSDIHLEILNREEREPYYFREVILRLDRDEAPVEFGANKITLNLFEPAVRRLILEERLPLGHILAMCRIPHSGCPKAYLRVQSDAVMNRAFGLAESHQLYGRRNTIWDAQQRPISEIVEILPP